MTTDMNFVTGSFVVKSNGKKYDVEIGGYDIEDALGVVSKIIDENPDVKEWVENDYGFIDVDEDMLHAMEEDNVIGVEYDALVNGDIESNDADFPSLYDCIDFLTNCEDAYNEDSDKFHAVIEAYGGFDEDAFKNCSLIRASNTEDFGRELAREGFIDIPEEIEIYFDFEKYGEDQLTDWTETEYGYLSSY